MMNNSFVNNVRALAPSVKQILENNAGITIDIESAGLKGVTIMLLLGMQAGYIDPIDLEIFLDDHGCGVDKQTSDFVLEAFAGEEFPYHLWYKDESGCLIELRGGGLEKSTFLSSQSLREGVNS